MTAVDVCIVGMGPAGLGAALGLARAQPNASVVCLDAGPTPGNRSCSIMDGRGCRMAMPCEVVSGVGGCSVLSGGKISAYPAGKGVGRILGTDLAAQQVLDLGLAAFREFVPLIEKEGDSDPRDHAARFAERGFGFQYYNAFTYRRTDLVAGYEAMLHEVTSKPGFSVQTGTRVIGMRRQGSLIRLTCEQGADEVVTFLARRVVLATGRMGGAVLDDVCDRLGAQRLDRDCDVGVRLEFPSRIWPDITACHGDLKLHFGRARTFCVCTDGILAPYRVTDRFFLTEGHSDAEMESGFTNLGITVRTSPATSEGHVFQALQQRAKSRVQPLRQALTDYLQDRPTQPVPSLPSSITYWRWGRLSEAFPPALADTIREAVRFFADRLLAKESWPEVSVFGPELDQYWPALVVDDRYRTGAPHVDAVGDVLGAFRGILQAFSTGFDWGRRVTV